MTDPTVPPPACKSSNGANAPYPPQQHQQPQAYYGQVPPPPAYGQPAYGYGPQQPGYGYPPQLPLRQQQPAPQLPYPGAVDPYSPQQQPPQYPYPAAYPATVAIPLTAISPINAAMPVAMHLPAANIGPPLPMEHIIELDLGVIRALPPHTGIATAEEAPGAHKEWVPRPLVWVEADWATKAFVYVSTRITQDAEDDAVDIHTYRCVLHRLDGAPCGALVETVTNMALADYLRAFHSLVEPARPQRRWKHSLLSGLCSLACVDFMLMPCCFVGRMTLINMDPQGAVVASYVGDALGCGDDSDWFPVCVNWMATPLMIVFYVPFPCLLCLGIAPCFSDVELRQRVARKHNIVETDCESGMTVCFCCPCSDIQVHREIESAGVWPGYCCCSRNAPLRSPEEVQRDFNAITREDVVRSRQGYNALSAVALQAMQ